MKRRAIGLVLLVTAACLAGCQLVFGYEAFDGAVDAGAPAHLCEVLPPVKVVALGHGPAVSRVNQPGASCSWMDQTEVTVEQYQEWLSATANEAPAWAGLGGESQCDWKAGAPSNPAGNPSDTCRKALEAQQERHEDQAFEANTPIRCVDWCDARAYCKWAGKRLCFGVNNSGLLAPGGKFPEWDLACSASGTRPYPYGGAYDPSACNVDQSNPAQGCVAANGGNTVCGPTSVGFLPGCRASRSAPADLSGNVQEWVDLCTKQGGADAQCNRRGGSYLDPADRATCSAIGSAARRGRDPTTGFRCCADLTPQEVANVQTNAPP